MSGPLMCASCETRPAACIGSYEGGSPITALWEPACNACCGHGNEDGACFLIQGSQAAHIAAQLAWVDRKYRTALESLNQLVEETKAVHQGPALVAAILLLED